MMRGAQQDRTRKAISLLVLLAGQEYVAIASSPTLPQLAAILGMASFVPRSSAEKANDTEGEMVQTCPSRSLIASGKPIRDPEAHTSVSLMQVVSTLAHRHNYKGDGKDSKIKNEKNLIDLATNTWYGDDDDSSSRGPPYDAWADKDSAHKWDWGDKDKDIAKVYEAYLPFAWSGKQMTDEDCARTVTGSSATNCKRWTWCKCPKFIDHKSSEIACTKGGEMTRIFKRKYIPRDLVKASDGCTSKPTCRNSAMSALSSPCVFMQWFLDTIKEAKGKIFRFLDSTALSSLTKAITAATKAAPGLHAMAKGFSFFGAVVSFFPNLFKTLGALFCGSGKCKGFYALVGLFFAAVGIVSFLFPPVLVAILGALAISSLAYGLIAVFVGTLARYLPDYVCSKKGGQSVKLKDIMSKDAIAQTAREQLDDPESSLSKEVAIEKEDGKKFHGKSNDEIALEFGDVFSTIGVESMTESEADLPLEKATTTYGEKAKDLISKDSDGKDSDIKTEKNLIDMVVQTSERDTDHGQDDDAVKFREVAAKSKDMEELFQNVNVLTDDKLEGYAEKNSREHLKTPDDNADMDFLGDDDDE